MITPGEVSSGAFRPRSDSIRCGGNISARALAASRYTSRCSSIRERVCERPHWFSFAPLSKITASHGGALERSVARPRRGAFEPRCTRARASEGEPMVRLAASRRRTRCSVAASGRILLPLPLIAFASPCQPWSTRRSASRHGGPRGFQSDHLEPSSRRHPSLCSHFKDLWPLAAVSIKALPSLTAQIASPSTSCRCPAAPSHAGLSLPQLRPTRRNLVVGCRASARRRPPCALGTAVPARALHTEVRRKQGNEAPKHIGGDAPTSSLSCPTRGAHVLSSPT